MVARAFIPDGYTQDCYIAEFPNVHEVVRFKFRPALPEAVQALIHHFDDKSAEEKGEIIDETFS